MTTQILASLLGKLVAPMAPLVALYELSSPVRMATPSTSYAMWLETRCMETASTLWEGAKYCTTCRQQHLAQRASRFHFPTARNPGTHETRFQPRYAAVSLWYCTA